MNAERLENALSGIREKTLNTILEERYRRNKNLKTHALPLFGETTAVRKRRFAVLAASFAVAILLLSAALAIRTRPQETVSDLPHQGETFLSPDLEQLYQTDRFSTLLPQLLPDSLHFASSLVTEDQTFCSLIFRSDDRKSDLEIQLRPFGAADRIADPAEPQTYRLSVYFDRIDHGELGDDLSDMTGLFRASDMSFPILQDRTYMTKEGLTVIRIELLCGNQVVSYAYTGESIDGVTFYRMIRSSDFFGEKEADSLPGYVPNFSSPTLAQLYMTAPFSGLLPQTIPSGCSFSESYLQEYDPIANPDGSVYLSVCFRIGEEPWDSLEIKIAEYDPEAVCSDPAMRESYDLARYYDLVASGVSGAEAEGLVGLFRAEDLTPEIVGARICYPEREFCKAEISVVCDSYVVSYCYNSKTDLSAGSFYEMITSADFFAPLS